MHHNVLHTGVGSGLLQRSAAVRIQRGTAGDQQIFHTKRHTGGAKGIGGSGAQCVRVADPQGHAACKAGLPCGDISGQLGGASFPALAAGSAEVLLARDDVEELHPVSTTCS